ncbi:hypothetical protein [Jannaschia seohaensis]|uniref:Uncharacterized protein n=1 Tax=Jannaschia seohaensis TaxID=475081 RepID=A0A2Y9B3M9_9RHOB|nr:hypothetical protein [Jannaschia seohaensis]PWJ15853.1 hypothetical protein BCF38_11073 [Jannaschia seohaensis]SSA49557.1 hypothetical protein SAMN05421539_11073 [Jannaschia seohaensis]
MKVPPSLDSAIASECRRLGHALAQLEGGLVAFARGEVDRDALVTELQAIDATHQTLEDLARILDVLARPAPADRTQATKALAAIRQGSVRTRLTQSLVPLAEDARQSTGPAALGPEDIELW